MKRIRVLALVLVFAFAALGGAYAAWSDSIFINETVNTGSVDIQWQNAETSDSVAIEGYWEWRTGWFGHRYKVWVPGTDGDPDVMADGYNNEEELDVAYKSAEIGDEDETIDAEVSTFWWWPPGDDEPDTYVKGQGDILNITLENGYPGYTAFVTADIANIGSVPVKCDFADEVSVPDWMKVQIVDADTDVVYWDSVDGRLAATPTIECDDCITVKITEQILDDAPQLSETTFTIEVIGIQWNAYEAPAV